MKLIILVFLFISVQVLHAQEKLSCINEQCYRVRILGEGKTTVVFENGMSDSLEVWGNIPDSVALFSKVFLYDRANIGQSDLSSKEPTLPQVVQELTGILEHEKLTPPYVLVGHSLGGLILRYFASEHPRDIKGILLLDPAPESHWNMMTKRQLRKYIKGGNKWYEDKFKPQYRKEWYNFIPNLSYMDSLSIPADIPFYLISASAWEWYPKHEDIIRGFSNTLHEEWKGDHYIFRSDPARTVNLIKELVDTKNPD